MPAASQTDAGAHGVTRPTTSKPAKPSALPDTRVVYGGDNLESLAKLTVSEILDEQIVKKLV